MTGFLGDFHIVILDGRNLHEAGVDALIGLQSHLNRLPDSSNSLIHESVWGFVGIDLFYFV